MAVYERRRLALRAQPIAVDNRVRAGLDQVHVLRGIGTRSAGSTQGRPDCDRDLRSRILMHGWQAAWTVAVMIKRADLHQHGR